MRKAEYVVLDTETTGLCAGRHGLTEIYAARVNGKGKVLDSFHSMINPGHHIPSFITRLTGIDDDMVKDAPRASRAISEFDAFMRPEDIMVGHNLRFDSSFLDYERRKALGKDFNHHQLCTLLLSRRVFSPHPLSSYKLGNLAQHIGICAEGAHRAQKDVEMTITLKQHLFDRLEQAKISSLPKVLGFQRQPLAKAARLMCASRDKSE